MGSQSSNVDVEILSQEQDLIFSNGEKSSNRDTQNVTFHIRKCMATKFTYLLISFIFTSFICSCGPSIDEMTQPWKIDKKFSVDHQELIIKAIEEWIDATDGIFNPESIFVDHVSPNESFSVELVSHDDDRVKKIEKSVNYTIGGAFYHKYDSIILVNEKYDYKTILHEFGHFMGLNHTTEVDVMSLGKSISCISKKNIDAFCLIRDCSGRNVHPTCEDE